VRSPPNEAPRCYRLAATRAAPSTGPTGQLTHAGVFDILFGVGAMR
jgi:hypothetical protein